MLSAAPASSRSPHGCPKVSFTFLRLSRSIRSSPPGARILLLEGGQRLVETRSVGEAGQGIGECESIMLDLLCIAFDGNRTQLRAGRDRLLLDLGRAAVFPKVERECAEHALAGVKDRT